MTTPVSNSTTTGPAANQPIDGASTLTTTRYQEIAAQFMSGLDTLTAIIPNLEVEHPSAVDTVQGHLSIPDAFLGSTIAAVEQTAGLQAVNQLDVPAGHDVLQFIDAFRPVVEKVNALGRNLKFTMSSRKSVLAFDALRVYEVAKGLARDPRNAPLVAHVKTMKRDLNRPGRPASKIPPDVRKAAKAAAKAASAAIIATARANTGVAKAQSQPPTTGDPTQNRDFKAGRDL
jgi:hypothetical protein